MLKELFESVMRAGQRDVAAVVPAPPSEPSDVYFLRDIDGNLERVKAEKPPFLGTVHDVGSLVEAADLMGGPHVFWYGRHRLFLQGEGGLARVRLPVTHSAPANWLHKACAVGDDGVQFSQRELLRFLKNTMAASGGDAYVGLIEKIQFKVLQEGEAEIRQAKVSLGKRLEAQLTGTDKMPDVMRFKIPAFVNIAEHKRYDITLTLDVNPQTEMFILRPLPDSHEQVMLAAEDDLLEQLALAIEKKGGEVGQAPVLFGTPEGKHV